MGKTTKIWLKIILGLMGALVLGVGIFVMLNWESAEILAGTEDLSSPSQDIPQAIEPAEALRQTGESDWPCWRGSSGDAKCTITGIKTDWSHGLKQHWQVDYLCQGPGSATWSAPVIQGDRVIVCGRDADKDLIFCLNANNGDLLWQNHYAATATSSHGAGMRATPTIDEDRIYTFGRSGDLVCWALHDGAILWQKNVQAKGGKAPNWGHSSSPHVTDELVIVQGGGTTRVIAYNKLNGEVIWTSGQGDAGYAPVISLSLENTPAALVFHGNGLAAMNRNTGEELWNIPWKTPYGVNATTPLVINNTVFITSGYGTGAQLLKVSDTEANIVWTNKIMAAHHSDGFFLDGFLYGYSGQSIQNKGVFKCIKLATGVESWSTKQMGWGTCVSVNGHLLCLDIKGNLFLMKPNPETFIKVTEMPKALGDVKGPVWTLPVLANDRLYLRFKQHLVCYSIKD